MNRFFVYGLALSSLLGGCRSPDESLLLGTLERERVTVTAQASERVMRIDVAEGDEVHAGDPILSLDPRRSDSRIEQARAEVRKAESVLAELRNGTRLEEIDAARAELNGAIASAENVRRERERLAAIRKRGLIAQADLDQAETALRNASSQQPPHLLPTQQVVLVPKLPPVVARTFCWFSVYVNPATSVPDLPVAVSV